MSAIRLHPEMTPPRLDCLARTERFELLNPERRGKRWGLALNFHRRKEWTSAAIGASLSPCRDKGRLAPSGILPRRRWCHCGASVVTALVPLQPKRIRKCRTAKPPERPSLRTPRAARTYLRSLRTFPRVRPAAGPSRRPSLPCSDSPRGQRSPPL